MKSHVSCAALILAILGLPVTAPASNPRPLSGIFGSPSEAVPRIPVGDWCTQKELSESLFQGGSRALSMTQPYALLLRYKHPAFVIVHKDYFASRDLQTLYREILALCGRSFSNRSVPRLFQLQSTVDSESAVPATKIRISGVLHDLIRQSLPTLFTFGGAYERSSRVDQKLILIPLPTRWQMGRDDREMDELLIRLMK